MNARRRFKRKIIFDAEQRSWSDNIMLALGAMRSILVFSVPCKAHSGSMRMEPDKES